jgi:CheY-like chemotaxis protein
MSAAVLVVHSGELGELLATQFRQYGLPCEHARNGEKALEMALHAKPQAVVVDVELGDVGGLELAELLKSELEVPVVVTYGRAMEFAENGNAFIERVGRLDGGFAKPFRSLALIGTVADLIGQPLHPAPTSQEGFPVEDEGDMDTGDILLLEDVVEQVLEADPHALDAAISQLDRTLEEDDEDDPFADLEIDETEENKPVDEASNASVSLSEFVADDAASDPTTLALLWKKVKDQPSKPPEPSAAAPSERSQLPLTPKSITETLDAFHQSQSTGEVWMVTGETKRALLLDRGVITGARSNDPSEDLARLCVRRKLLSIDQAREAQAHAERETEVRSFVAAVLTLKMASKAQMAAALLERAKRVVCGGFLASGGVLRVTYQGAGASEFLPIALQVADAVTRAIILTEPLEALRAAAPDDARFSPEVGGAYGLDQLQLNADEARLVVAMDGTKTIGDLATLHDGIPERTLRGLPSALARIGLIHLAGRGPAEAKRISFF